MNGTVKIPAGARVPLGNPPAWLAAALKAGWQCQCTTDGKGRAKAGCGRNHWEQHEHRCQHSAAGACAMRLVLTPDATGAVLLLCEPCATGHTRTAARIQALLPQPDPASYGQGALF